MAVTLDELNAKLEELGAKAQETLDAVQAIPTGEAQDFQAQADKIDSVIGVLQQAVDAAKAKTPQS